MGALMLLSPNSKVSTVRSRPVERSAPLAGLNTRMPIQARGEKGFALQLDNWICRPDGLHVRKGWRRHAGVVGPVRSLLTYKSSVMGRADDDWIGAEIKHTGGVHLVATGTSGTIDPLWFDGRRWQVAAITGVNSKRLRGACRHGERLFFYEVGTFRVWYLGLDAVGGPATLLPLDMLFRKGGAIGAIGSTTSDGGVGGNDQFVVVTTAGEVAVYTGENPQDAAKWGLVGTFRRASRLDRAA
jgi:hypothetical protein